MQQINYTIPWMHELYAYAGMRIYLTMQSTTKTYTEINYGRIYETNYCKIGNYATNEKSN